MRKFFPVLVTGSILLGAAFFLGNTPGVFAPLPADAAYNANAPHMKGWVWSSNIGWISLSCEDRGVCATSPYTVEISPSGTSGVNNLDGYAWSNNIGWISFKRSSAGNPPQAPLNGGAGPIAQMNGSALVGWARAVAPNISGVSGWDGWIRLSDSAAPAGAYGVVKNSANNFLEGFVWGGDVVGWARFSQTYGAEIVTPFDMSVAITPSVTATQGQFADISFSSTLLSGTAQNVTYTIAGAIPTGMSFSPATWTCQPSSAGCPVSFRVITTSATPPATYNFQLVPSAVTPSTPAPIAFSVIVSGAPTTCNFIIRDPQPAVSIPPGGSQAVTFQVQEVTGFSCGTVALTSVVPSGITATNPADCDPGPTCSSTVTITANAAATAGTYNVTINGSSGGFSNELQIPVTVTGCAGACITDSDFTMRHSPLDDGENCPSGTIVGGSGPCTGSHAPGHFVRDIQIGGTSGSTESSNTILTIYPSGAFNSSVAVSIDSVMEDTNNDGIGDVAVASSLFSYKFARLTRATYTILPAQFGSTLFQVQLTSSDVDANAGRYVIRLRARGSIVQDGTPSTVDRYTNILVVVGATTPGFVGGTGGPGSET